MNWKEIPLPLLILGFVAMAISTAVTGWIVYILATGAEPVAAAPSAPVVSPSPEPVPPAVPPRTVTTITQEESDARYGEIQILKKNLEDLIAQERARNEELERKIAQLETLTDMPERGAGAEAISGLETEISRYREETKALLAVPPLTERQEAQVAELLRAGREGASDAE